MYSSEEILLKIEKALMKYNTSRTPKTWMRSISYEINKNSKNGGYLFGSNKIPSEILLKRNEERDNIADNVIIDLFCWLSTLSIDEIKGIEIANHIGQMRRAITLSENMELEDDFNTLRDCADSIIPDGKTKIEFICYIDKIKEKMKGI